MLVFSLLVNLDFLDVLTRNNTCFYSCLMLHSGYTRSYWERTDGCTANQERKGKETVTISFLANRKIGFDEILEFL